VLLKEKIRYEGQVLTTHFKKDLTTITRSPIVGASMLTLPLNIYVYGTRDIADDIATGLSKYRLFLQHPWLVPLGITYQNPQCFGKIGTSLTNGFILPPISVENSQRPNDIELPSESSDPDIDEVMAVIDDIPGQNYSTEADIDIRIKTSLKRLVFYHLSLRERTDSTSKLSKRGCELCQEPGKF
jgi:hypothetical protein